MVTGRADWQLRHQWRRAQDSSTDPPRVVSHLHTIAVISKRDRARNAGWRKMRHGLLGGALVASCLVEHVTIPEIQPR
jgi:hypothetical protein